MEFLAEAFRVIRKPVLLAEYEGACGFLTVRRQFCGQLGADSQDPGTGGRFGAFIDYLPACHHPVVVDVDGSSLQVKIIPAQPRKLSPAKPQGKGEQMIEHGVDIKTVQSRLVHSDISTTLNIYSHMTEQMNRNAADKLDEVLFSK